MRLSLMILAFAVQAAVLESFAQETKQPSNTYTVPDEHKEFVHEFNVLIEKFPKAKMRFKLAEMGDAPLEKNDEWELECEAIGGPFDNPIIHCGWRPPK